MNTVTLDAFPFDDELEAVENVGSDEHGDHDHDHGNVMRMSEQEDEEPGNGGRLVSFEQVSRAPEIRRGRSAFKGITPSGIESLYDETAEIYQTAVGGPLSRARFSSLNNLKEYVERRLGSHFKDSAQSYLIGEKCVCKAETVGPGLSVEAAKLTDLPEVVVRKYVYELGCNEEVIMNQVIEKQKRNLEDGKFVSANNCVVEDGTDDLRVNSDDNGSLGDGHNSTDDPEWSHYRNFSASYNHAMKWKPAAAPDQVREAVAAVRMGCLSLARAANLYKVSLETLQERLALEIGSSDNVVEGSDEPSQNTRHRSCGPLGRFRSHSKPKVDYSTKRKCALTPPPHSLRKAVEHFKAGMSITEAAAVNSISASGFRTTLGEMGLLPSTSSATTVKSAESFEMDSEIGKNGRSEHEMCDAELGRVRSRNESSVSDSKNVGHSNDYFSSKILADRLRHRRNTDRLNESVRGSIPVNGAEVSTALSKKSRNRGARKNDKTYADHLWNSGDGPDVETAKAEYLESVGGSSIDNLGHPSRVEQSSDNLVVNRAALGETPVAKRGRGRPRKVVGGIGKRKRGRPRKFYPASVAPCRINNAETVETNISKGPGDRSTYKSSSESALGCSGDDNLSQNNETDVGHLSAHERVIEPKLKPSDDDTVGCSGERLDSWSAEGNNRDNSRRPRDHRNKKTNAGNLPRHETEFEPQFEPRCSPEPVKTAIEDVENSSVSRSEVATAGGTGKRKRGRPRKVSRASVASCRTSTAEIIETNVSERLKDRVTCKSSSDDALECSGDQDRVSNTDNLRRPSERLNKETNVGDLSKHERVIEPKLKRRYSHGLMTIAIEAVENGTMSCCDAAKYYRIPRSSLWDQLKKRSHEFEPCAPSYSPALGGTSDGQPANFTDSGSYSGLDDTGADETLSPEVERGCSPHDSSRFDSHAADGVVGQNEGSRREIDSPTETPGLENLHSSPSTAEVATGLNMQDGCPSLDEIPPKSLVDIKELATSCQNEYQRCSAPGSGENAEFPVSKTGMPALDVISQASLEIHEERMGSDPSQPDSLPTSQPNPKLPCHIREMPVLNRIPENPITDSTCGMPILDRTSGSSEIPEEQGESNPSLPVTSSTC